MSLNKHFPIFFGLWWRVIPLFFDIILIAFCRFCEITLKNILKIEFEFCVFYTFVQENKIFFFRNLIIWQRFLFNIQFVIHCLFSLHCLTAFFNINRHITKLHFLRNNCLNMNEWMNEMFKHSLFLDYKACRVVLKTK